MGCDFDNRFLERDDVVGKRGEHRSIVSIMNAVAPLEIYDQLAVSHDPDTSNHVEPTAVKTMTVASFVIRHAHSRRERARPAEHNAPWVLVVWIRVDGELHVAVISNEKARLGHVQVPINRDIECLDTFDHVLTLPTRTRYRAAWRVNSRALAVTGGWRRGDLFQTPFGHSVFDAVGQPRARPGKSGLTAGLPDLGEIRTALRGFAVPLHRRMSGTELLHLHRDVTEPAVDGHQARCQVSLAATLGGLPHRGGAVGIRSEIGWSGKASIPRFRISTVIVVCAVEPQHRL